MMYNRPKEPKRAFDGRPIAKDSKKILKNKCKEYWKEWLSFSTMHGIQNIARSDSYIIIVLWIIFLVISLGVCFYLIAGLVLNFLNFNVLILINVINESPVDFPAVTICNLNFLDRRLTNGYIDSVLAKNNLSGERNIRTMTKTPEQISDLLRAAVFADKDISEQERETNFGFSIKDMLLTCSFNDITCTAEDFTYSYDYHYGNCYTFNNGYFRNGSKAPIRQISEAGSDRSFKMDIFLGDDRFQNDFIANSGARVVVHNQSTIPILSSEGFDISTGYQTNIGIRRSFLSKLDDPYSDCIKNASSPSSYGTHFYQVIFSVLNMTTYRHEVCIRLCLQEHIKKQCSCIDGSLYNIYGSSALICATIADLDCVKKARVSYYADVELSQCSQCPQECDSIEYLLSTSNSRYPSMYYLEYLRYRTEIEKKIRGDSNKSVDGNQIIKSSTLLNVFYDDLATTYINEVPAISPDQLLGVIGGNLGLFIGISLLSIVEIFELVVQLLIYYCKYLNNTLV